MEFLRPQLSASESYTLGLKLGCEKIYKGRLTPSGSFLCANQKARGNKAVERRTPQNVDFPPVLPKKKKKPYPIPIKETKQAAREDKKLAQMGIEKPLESPKNGLLVRDLIPVAYEVFDAWKLLIKVLDCYCTLFLYMAVVNVQKFMWATQFTTSKIALVPPVHSVIVSMPG